MAALTRSRVVAASTVVALALMILVVLPDRQVPALPPPVTLREQVESSERQTNSLVVSPQPIFERTPAGGDQQEPIEVASPDDEPAPPPTPTSTTEPPASTESPDDDTDETVGDDTAPVSDDDGDGDDGDDIDTPDSAGSADSPDD